MDEQSIMNAYYGSTRLEVRHQERWVKAKVQDVNAGTRLNGEVGLTHINLRLLKDNGFPSMVTKVVAYDEFATLLRGDV